MYYFWVTFVYMYMVALRRILCTYFECPIAVSVIAALKVFIIVSTSVSSTWSMVSGANRPPVITCGILPLQGLYAF